MQKTRTREQKGKDSYRKGHRAELLCRLSLRLKGYKIIAQRYRNHHGEIDIIATRGATLAFIEVKARPTYLEASEAVTDQQRVRIGKCASLFLAHVRGYSRFTLRFDIMVVLPWHWPIHIDNAFQTEVRI